MRWLMAACAAVLLASCGDTRKAEPAEPPGPPTVPVVRASRQTLVRDVTLAGEFRAFQEVDVHAKVAGYLREIRVDEGDHVHGGDLLATIEIPELADEQAQAAAAREHAESELSRAQSELQRAEAAHSAAHTAYARLATVSKERPNLVAAQEIDDALARDRAAEAQVSAAQAAVESARRQITVARAGEARLQTLSGYMKIPAPFDGVIGKRYADTGALIQAGTSSNTQAIPLVRVLEVDKLRLSVDVPESAVTALRVGGQVEVKVPALSRSLLGRVSRFSNRLKSETRTMETEIDLDNPKGELLPGMVAEVRLVTQRRDKTLAIPVQAVVGAGDTSSLWVLDPAGKVAARDVSLGMETSEWREVLSGLADGDAVVVGKPGNVKPGDTVTVKETK